MCIRLFESLCCKLELCFSPQNRDPTSKIKRKIEVFVSLTNSSDNNIWVVLFNWALVFNLPARQRG